MTTKNVVALLQVDEKTVLRLCHRKLLTAIPGIRHKRFTEDELNRFLKCRNS
ncbi:MAG TPA: helix-turn-helix domain-containing protein [Verrucomicrobiae bacterium]|nr:helix-turn-helix domain-containing protein [Verrucomicrobiae bacterium]